MKEWTLGQMGKTNPNEPKRTQNEAKFKKAKMNVTSIITVCYENISNWAICENEPNSNPKQSQSNPISKQLQSLICPGNVLINRMNQNCCVCSFSVSFESAKMAQYKNNWNLKKDGKKKLNLLKCKRLNNLSRLQALTGTLFAYSNPRNFLYTDGTQ
jgi:hypothetical protein